MTGSVYSRDTTQSTATRASHISSTGRGDMFAYLFEADDFSSELLSTVGTACRSSSLVSDNPSPDPRRLTS